VTDGSAVGAPSRLELVLKRAGFTVGMDGAVLRRAGFIATIATGLAMLVAAVHGVARVDSTLQLAAAAPPGQSRFVVDVRGRREPAPPLGAWGDCDHGHGDGGHPRV
jgi:hypothetical protein